MSGFDYLNKGYSCVVFREEKIVFSSKDSGIKPLLQIIHESVDVFGCEAFDKIVGRAAALLYVYMGASRVCAEVMSEGAKAVFESSGVLFEYKTLAEKIINRNGDGICPMESAVIGINEPKKALIAIEKKIMELKQNVKENRKYKS